MFQDPQPGTSGGRSELKLPAASEPTAQALRKGGKLAGVEELQEDSGLGFAVPQVQEKLSFECCEKIRANIQRAQARGEFLPDDPWRVIPSELVSLIDALSERLSGRPVMVRSNSICEGAFGLSFAGIYESALVKRPSRDALARAIVEVCLSADSAKAERYRAEHGITEDRLGIFIQEYVAPKWSGKIFSTDPTLPDRVTVEFAAGRFEEARTKYIVEIDKRSGEVVFQSDNFTVSMEDELPESFFSGLAEIARGLEFRRGVSELEWLTSLDGALCFLQRRPITDIQPEEAPIEIPEYAPAQFIGKTRIFRGKGRLTLPVVKIPELDDELEYLSRNRPSWMGSLAAGELAACCTRGWFETIDRFNAAYPDGYILVTPHFDETLMLVRCVSARRPVSSFNALTHNKKAILTTRIATKSTHAMSAARDSGVLCVGFDHSEELFDTVATGDLLSIYIVAGEAQVYRENAVPPSFKQSLPAGLLRKELMDDGLYALRILQNYENYERVYQDFARYVTAQLGSACAFVSSDEEIGAVFKMPGAGEERALKVSGCRKGSEWVEFFAVHPQYLDPEWTEQPLPAAEVKGLWNGWVESLFK